FLWTLWNNQFSSFDPRRLLRSLAVLFGTAFVLKHVLLASLYSPDGGWLKKLAGTLLQGASLGTLDAPTFAPATGYISFFALALYVAGLLALTFASADDLDEVISTRQLTLPSAGEDQESIGNREFRRIEETTRETTRADAK
ncbi:MAG TPA: hypothetical protein VMS31_00175, partial [Pyrinomonadaceae bacterium]|nr:hypothetical protein [Pyrinomonadaceae bacterium]